MERRARWWNLPGYHILGLREVIGRSSQDCIGAVCDESLSPLFTEELRLLNDGLGCLLLFVWWVAVLA